MASATSLTSFWLSPAAIGERLEQASDARGEVSRLSEHVGAIRVETAAAKTSLDTLRRACADRFAQRAALTGGTKS